MIDKNVPCYNCDKRSATSEYNCHSDCPDYKAYKQAREDKAEAIRKCKAEDNMVKEVRIRAMLRHTKDVNANKQNAWKG